MVASAIRTWGTRAFGVSFKAFRFVVPLARVGVGIKGLNLRSIKVAVSNRLGYRKGLTTLKVKGVGWLRSHPTISFSRPTSAVLVCAKKA